MSKKQHKKIIGITMGDPAGIGPEIISKALTQPNIQKLAHFIVIGDHSIYQSYSLKNSDDFTFIDLNTISTHECRPGKTNVYCGQSSLAYLTNAVHLLKNKEIDALVTAPICKESILATKKKFHGHTEFLAESFNIPEVGMLFVADKLKTIIVTRHMPLNEVSQNITQDSVFKTITLTHEALQTLFKIDQPRLAICGLNPHAGEGGHMGKEEQESIIPAINQAQKMKINIVGPLAADTVFYPPVAKQYDVIISMYHDQGLVGIKSVALDKLVNLTIGLPFIRTSPAHGTAFDIAGKGKADPSSFCEAIKLAATLSDPLSS